MILVTGATGLIGSHVLAKLCAEGKSIRAIYRSEVKKEEFKRILLLYTQNVTIHFSSIEWVVGDINDPFSVDEFMKGIEEVYHCAGSVDMNENHLKKLLKTNAEGTANIINACLRYEIKKLIHVSSVSVLTDRSKSTELNEETGWKASKNNSAYSISKYNAEREVWRGMEEGLNIIIVNPTVVIGTGNWENSSGKIIGACYKGMKYFSEGVTGYVDARDVAEVMVLLMEGNHYGQRFVLNSENLSFFQVFSMFSQAFGKENPKIKITLNMMALIGFLEKITSFIRGKERLINKSTLKAAFEIQNYSNQKVVNTLKYRFIPISESITFTSKNYLHEFSNK